MLFHFSRTVTDERRIPKNVRPHHSDEKDFVDAENVVPFDVVKNVGVVNDDDSSNVVNVQLVQDGKQLDVQNEFVGESAAPDVETDVVIAVSVVDSDNDNVF